jgi:hypothetical protein
MRHSGNARIAWSVRKDAFRLFSTLEWPGRPNTALTDLLIVAPGHLVLTHQSTHAVRSKDLAVERLAAAKRVSGTRPDPVDARFEWF